MSNQETERPDVAKRIFEDPESYDEYLCSRGIPNTSRAIGTLYPDGSIDVAIDKTYYLRGGILEEQLEAIVLHERIELTAKKGGDKLTSHLLGTLAEYNFIFNRYGEAGLQKYHANLCNLMGGRNDERNFALRTVLDAKPI